MYSCHKCSLGSSKSLNVNDVTKQEAIMEQGNQVGISLLKLFLDSVLLGEKKKEILSLYCGQKTFVFMYLNIQYW